MAQRRNPGWKLMLLVLLSMAAVAGIFLLKPIPQDLSYHNFADKRASWGIPNFANVVSNLPFLFAGIGGLAILRRGGAYKGILIIYGVMFTGIFLTGMGSAYYHYAPDNNSLVFDRIPMTLVFMALLSATIAEFIDMKSGVFLLIPLLITGIGSVVLWHIQELHGAGDLRLYAFVQFYPVLFIPVTMLLFPSREFDNGFRPLMLVVIWYIIAKLFEHFDKPVYLFLHFVSGHTLKHLAAAVSTWYLVKLFRLKHLSGNRQ